MTTFGAQEINDVLRVIRSMSDDGDIQLSILTRALVVGCKSCEIDKAHALKIIGNVFDEELKLVPLSAETN